MKEISVYIIVITIIIITGLWKTNPKKMNECFPSFFSYYHNNNNNHRIITGMNIKMNFNSSATTNDKQINNNNNINGKFFRNKFYKKISFFLVKQTNKQKNVINKK